jgi:hypothetical protein
MILAFVPHSAKVRQEKLARRLRQYLVMELFSDAIRRYVGHSHWKWKRKKEGLEKGFGVEMKQ